MQALFAGIAAIVGVLVGFFIRANSTSDAMNPNAGQPPDLIDR